MNKILDFLNSDMKKPLLYGPFSDSWFQYLSLLLLIMASIYAVIKMKDLNDKQVNKVLLSMGITMIIFEIYKQVIFSYQADWDYMWYAFPFQFCSVGMYLAPITAFIKNKKVRTASITFLGTYSFFSGLAVMLYPATVFVTTIGINIQTMVHHGLLSVVGLGLLVNQVKTSYKSFLGAMVVFAVLVAIAVGMNIIHNQWIKDGTFNMFFINPKYDTGLPILELIQPKVDGITYIFVYYFGFSFIAFILFLTTKIIKEIIVKPKNLELQL